MSKDDLRNMISEYIPKIDEFEKEFYTDVKEQIGTDKANVLLVARDVAYIKGVADCLTSNDVSIVTNLMAALIRIQAFEDKEGK